MYLLLFLRSEAISLKQTVGTNGTYRMRLRFVCYAITFCFKLTVILILVPVFSGSDGNGNSSDADSY